MAQDLNTLGNEDALLDSEGDFLSSFREVPTVKAYLRGYANTVVAAKGMGKSATLMRKAIDLRSNPSILVIPSNRALVDFAAAESVPVLSKLVHRLAGEETRVAFWTAIWKKSILQAVAHRYLREDLAPHLRSDLQEVVGKTTSQELLPYHFYSRTLADLESKPTRELVGSVGELVARVQAVLGRYPTIPPTYILIDNNDNFYEDQPAMWSDSGFGQFRAILDLHLDFGHQIHVYNSMREEIYAATVNRSEQHANWLSALHHLRWRRDDLLELLGQRVRRLRPDCLRERDRARTDPVHAFLGSTKLRNLHTKSLEERTAYFLRHTLGRPRDVIVLGNRILEAARTRGDGSSMVTDDDIREGVARGADIIARQYEREVQPFLQRAGIQSFDLFLRGENRGRSPYRGIQSAVVDVSIAEQIRNSYYRRFLTGQPGFPTADDFHPFCALVKIGLVGWVDETHHRGGPRQNFAQPGEGPRFDLDVRHLHSPRTRYYVLHPILIDQFPHLVANGVGALGKDLPLRFKKTNSQTTARKP